MFIGYLGRLSGNQAGSLKENRLQLLHNKPDTTNPPVLILAHGAGAAMDSPFMDDMASRLCDKGIHVIRFEFPYMAGRRNGGKKRPPDRQPVLLETWREVIQHAVSDTGGSVWIGGKSMGGRMATLLAAGESNSEYRQLPVAGVICLGYPFHPLGKPEKIRVEHLPAITQPVLICQGTRDPMGSQEEVAAYCLPKSLDIKWLEDGNHDLKPRKVSGFSHENHLQTTANAVAHFVA